jgi:signal transduction histidine kinase
LLAQRSEELYSANKKLAEHAHALSHTVIAQREENAALIGRSTRTQAALEVATEKAVIAERRLWDALSAVEDGFAIFDRDWRLVVANPAWMGAFDGVVDVAPGASYEAILRIAVEEGLIDLQGEDADDWVDRMIARWEGASIAQTDIRLFNGIYVRLIDKRTPQGDMVSLSLDITDTIRREGELERARDRAEAATRAKSAFLANMSHEIRTPMNGVVAMAGLLREMNLTEDQRLNAETIQNSGEALLAIINDILDYSKIDAGKMILHEESFDLRHLIDEIFRLMRPGLEGKDLRLILDYDMFLPARLIGDPGRVRQILTNLIGNAVKFTESGHVTVRAVGVPDPKQPALLPVRIVVEDTGIGIAPEMQSHIFGEFNQVEAQATRRFDGTGLGLAITRQLVALMGGNLA